MFFLKFNFLSLGLLSVLCLMTLSYAKSNPHTEKPNIIFILTDDQRWDALGHSGNKIIETPNIDQLATDGVYFSNAFVTTPICAASRASIVTGLYERTHQFTFNTPPLSNKFIDISYFHQLKEHGYHTGFLGKFGMSFEDQMDTALFDHYDPYMARFYYRLTGEGWSEHKYLTYQTGEKAINFIENAPDDQPFCLSISFNAPHAEDQSPDQYIYPEDLKDLYEDITIPDPPLIENKYFDKQPDYVKESLGYIRWLWRFDSPEKYQEMVKAYYRMITAIDKVLGEIREALTENGLEDNTIIIFTSDNGYFLGERGLAGKWLMYENSIRVPLIIFDPREESEYQENDQLVLNIDIAPTIMEYAGIKVPANVQGHSLLPAMKDPSFKIRDQFLCEHLYELKFIPKSEGIRTEKWKYFRYIDDPNHEELYDLLNDPLEMNNLINDNGSNSELEFLRRECDVMIEELIKAR